MRSAVALWCACLLCIGTLFAAPKAAVDAPEPAPAPADATAEAVTAEDAAVPAAAAARPSAAPGFKVDGFIAGDRWQGDGVIATDKDKKLMISAGDTVFVVIAPDLAAPGTVCNIYRRLKKVKDPETGDKLGREIRLIGTLVITADTGDGTATAKITNSRESIEAGDILRALR